MVCPALALPAWIAATSPAADAALWMPAMASRTAESVVALVTSTPIEIARSAGPTYTPVSPGTAHISSTSATAAAVSIIANTLTRDSSFVVSAPRLARNRSFASRPRGAAGGRDGRGRLVGRFDHRDDHRVGAGVEDPPDRCRVGVGQPHRRGDWHVFESAQHARDIGVVDELGGRRSRRSRSRP